MPMYDYRCKACGARFEAWQKFTDDPISVCPTCSGPAQRVIHAAGIMFKGSGFYVTDNKGSGAVPAASEKTEKTGSDSSAPTSGVSPASPSTSSSSASAAPSAPAAKAS